MSRREEVGNRWQLTVSPEKREGEALPSYCPGYPLPG